MNKHEAAAVILAGGKSTRMGRDKGLLEFRNKTFVEHLVDTLKPHFAEVIISANDTAPYKKLGARVIADQDTEGGALAGVAAALDASRHELNFVVSCDSPIIVMQVVQRLLGGVEGHDCAVVVGDSGQFEPLFAVYRRSLLPRMQAQLKEPERSMHALLAQCKVKTVSVRRGTLININTPEEYEAFLRTHV